MTMTNNKKPSDQPPETETETAPAATETEQKSEPSLDQLLANLPIADEYKQLIGSYIATVNSSIIALNEKLTALENKPVTQPLDKGALSGLTAEQKYNILMAQASAPAAAAQQNLLGAMLARLGGGGGGDSGGFGGLIGSAKALNELRAYLVPAASPLDQAMQKAQVSQMVAQTRLLNKISGKASDQYLDSIMEELSSGGGAEQT